MNMQAQLAWESECLNRGTQSYYAQQDRMRENGEVTDAINHVFKERLQDVADRIGIVANTSRGVSAAYNKLLKSAALDEDYLKVAYIGLQSVFRSVFSAKDSTILSVCLAISSRLETDLKCQLFEAKYPAYYAVVNKSFKEQKVTDYVHKHKVLMMKFNEFDLDWNDWTTVQKVQVGQRVLRCILDVFEDVFFINMEWKHGKSTNKLDTTVLFDEWAGVFERERGMLFPSLLPLKIQPRDWDEHGQGGYYSTALAANFKLVKTRGKEHAKYVRDNDPKLHRKAINKMQATSWQINQQVLDVQKEIYKKGLGIGIPSSKQIKVVPFPEHLRLIEKSDLTAEQEEEVSLWKVTAKMTYQKEQERKGQVIAFMQSHKLAKELADWDKFYFAYNCDFRGRIYCATSGLSPQGADSAKGLLRFNESVRLGSSGIWWLAIHGANVFGNDKISYADRVRFIKDSEQYIRAVIEDPIGTRSYWGKADKPYQFLAFCYEWASCDYGRDTYATGQLPIGLDGSCNGLQHFSAMLRDRAGAKSTNLCSTELPEDIYGDVAKVTVGKLNGLTDAISRKWVRAGVTRKATKKPVMTVPYGAKMQSAREALLDYTKDNWAKFDLAEHHQWEFAKHLTPIVWDSIGEVVSAARMAMSWLQKNTPKDYCHWLTPIGFPVYQYYHDSPSKEVNTQLNGRLRIYIRDRKADSPAKMSRQRSGIAPNFVHSIDSTHMVLTIAMTDLPAYAMIHDDYGTHAGNTQHLFDTIRKSFHKLYSECDPLDHWAMQQGLKCNLPKGDYDINEILQADYFFG